VNSWRCCVTAAFADVAFACFVHSSVCNSEAALGHMWSISPAYVAHVFFLVRSVILNLHFAALLEQLACSELTRDHFSLAAFETLTP